MLNLASGLLVILGVLHLSGASGNPVNVTGVSSVANLNNVPQLASNSILLDDTMYYIETTRGRHWYAARAACESMGYNLVSFETAKKFNAINRYLNDQGDTYQYWTSGNDLTTPGRHVWLPSGKPVASNLWYPGEPNNKEGIEHCDEFRFQGTQLMNDEDCTVKRYYICERSLK